ncbi:MAG TPA: DUF2892 domain-containing protein [Bradyrhizobium sp.]|nr:DUF2892 domain-containing protein [Bradyrhizobium sp.]
MPAREPKSRQRGSIRREHSSSLAKIKGVAMFYRRNLPAWERVARVLGGAAMVACGLVGLPSLPIGYLIAGAGVVTVMTGFFGFCPMCAMAGRRLPSP